MKTKILTSLLVLLSLGLIAQVSINTDGADPDSSAMLDLKSTTKGMLIPRITLTGVNDATTIATPATSLLIYNTATVTGLTPGYYHNSGTTGTPVWTRLATGINDGSESKVTAGTNVIVTGEGTTASPYVVNTTDTLAIGDTYQGGIIFWLDASGQHGLIADTADQSSIVQWYNGTYTVTNAVRDGVGAGKLNTERIIANQGAGDYAAQICANFQGGNYGDWYLPSKYELNLLYLQKTVVGGFDNTYYWSSSEKWEVEAWYLDFNNGNLYSNEKIAQYAVRAIRAF